MDLFGEATFEVIDDDPTRLTAVPGIGPIRAGRIAATWAEQRHIREEMAALQGHGISTSLRLDDGREVRYPYASLFALTHAYAISVHKNSPPW